MSGTADSTFSGSSGETADTVDGGVTQAGSVGTRLAEAPPPAETMTRDQYANDMRQGPAADLGDDTSGGDGSDEDGEGYFSESGDGDYSWTDLAVQAQGSLRDEYADYMQRGPAAGEDDPASVGTADWSGPGGEPEATRPASGAGASQLQGTSRTTADLDTGEQPLEDLAPQAAVAEDGAGNQVTHPVFGELGGDGDLPAGRRTGEEATSEVQSRTAPSMQNAEETDPGADVGETSVAEQDDTQGMRSSADEPSAEERAHLREVYQDYRKEYGSGWAQGTNVVGDKPDKSPGDHSDLPPTGEALIEPGDENATRAEKLHNLLDRDFDDVDDAFKNVATSVQQVLDQPPPTGHPGVVVDTHPQWVPESTPSATPDIGNLAELGLVLGVLGDRTVQYVRHKVAEMRGRG